MVDHITAGGVTAADFAAHGDKGGDDILGTAGACEVQWREAAEGAAFEEGSIAARYVFNKFQILILVVFRWRCHDCDMKKKFVYFC